MGFQINFIKQNNYFLIKTSGATYTEDITLSLEKVIDSSDWSKGIPILYDNRDGLLAHLSRSDMEKISSVFIQFDSQLSGSKVALVMASDVSYGLGRMFQFLTDGATTFKTKIFRTIDDARIWINKVKVSELNSLK